MFKNSIKDLEAGLNKRGNNGTISISLITAKDALLALGKLSTPRLTDWEKVLRILENYADDITQNNERGTVKDRKIITDQALSALKSMSEPRPKKILVINDDANFMLKVGEVAKEPRLMEECPECKGEGEICQNAQDYDWKKCKMCGGTGKKPSVREECEWKEVEEYEGESWETSCGENFVLPDGTPEENKINYCHHCGKKVKVIRGA